MESKYQILDALMTPIKDAEDVLRDRKTYKKPGITELETKDLPQPEGPQEQTIMESLQSNLESAGDNISDAVSGAGRGIAKAAKATGRGIKHGVGAVGAWGNENPVLLQGAAPLLMGALMGDIGVGASVGAEGIAQAHKYAREDIEEEAKKNKAAKDTKLQAKRVWNKETGKWDWQNYNPVTGEFQSIVGAPTSKRKKEDLQAIKDASDIKMGRHLKTVDGPEGQKMVWDKVNQRTAELFPNVKFKPSQKKVIAKAEDFVMKKLEPSVASYRNMEDAFKDFKKGDTIAMKGALMNIVKEAQGGGKLSDFDVQFLQYAFGKEKPLELAEEFASGKMNKRLAREIHNKMEGNIERARKGLVRGFSRVYRMGEREGVSSSRMRKILGGEGFDRAVIKVNGKEMTVPSQDLDSLMKQTRYQDLEVIRYE